VTSIIRISYIHTKPAVSETEVIHTANIGRVHTLVVTTVTIPLMYVCSRVCIPAFDIDTFAAVNVLQHPITTACIQYAENLVGPTMAVPLKNIGTILCAPTGNIKTF